MTQSASNLNCERDIITVTATEDAAVPAATKTKRKSNATRPIFVGDHMVVDPRVCHGQLTFRGTRVPVETNLCYLGRGYSRDYLRKSWPQVSAEAIEEALRLASERLIRAVCGRIAHYGVFDSTDSDCCHHA